MGICWSDPPPPPVITTAPTLKPCRMCGVWTKGSDYCEPCLQKNAMQYIAPSAPPMYSPPQQQPHYTYAVPYEQQRMYAYQYYQARPPQQPQPQQQQMGIGTAALGGFVLGAIAEDILDPTE